MWAKQTQRLNKNWQFLRFRHKLARCQQLIRVNKRKRQPYHRTTPLSTEHRLHTVFASPIGISLVLIFIYSFVHDVPVRVGVVVVVCFNTGTHLNGFVHIGAGNVAFVWLFFPTRFFIIVFHFSRFAPIFLFHFAVRCHRRRLRILLFETIKMLFMQMEMKALCARLSSTSTNEVQLKCQPKWRKNERRGKMLRVFSRNTSSKNTTLIWYCHCLVLLIHSHSIFFRIFAWMSAIRIVAYHLVNIPISNVLERGFSLCELKSSWSTYTILFEDAHVFRKRWKQNLQSIFVVRSI